MEFQYIARNHDLGACMPTFQERVNSTMLPVDQSAVREGTAAAPALHQMGRPQTPHLPSASEVEQTLSMMETEAQNKNLQLLKVHSGLNKERVDRLLNLLR
ncbi:MAG: pseudouridine synthase [Desulfovibrio sp.]|nr:pseudouridine synthase [Desulfovibrio sp.]